MAKIANKQVICDVLMREAEKDKDIVALCSDSRGSASFSKFAAAAFQPFPALAPFRIIARSSSSAFFSMRDR